MPWDGARVQNICQILRADIYIRVSLGGHNMGTFYARKLNFGMLLTQT